MSKRMGVGALGLLLGAACSTYTLPGSLGEQCELNSDCDAPLVCRLGYCRVECASARDCAAGLDCVYDNEQRGACQLLDETSCDANSDCPMQLVCTMGECTNPCNCPPDAVPCRDCPPGAACIDDDGARACLDTSTVACVYDSDCRPDGSAPFEVCAADGRCRVECVDYTYCRNGERCEAVSFVEDGMTVVGMLCIFAGARDGGAGDAGNATDGGAFDAGPSDGGSSGDGGVARDGGMDGG